MIVYKKNSFTNKYYKYDLDDYDYFGPMFDESLHNNNITPKYDKYDTTCAYCGTSFCSRNQLFYHLGFMNIDIKKRNMVYDKGDDDMELGDYGYIIEDLDEKPTKRSKTIYRIRMKTKYVKKKRKNVKKTKFDLISEMLNNVSLN